MCNLMGIYERIYWSYIDARFYIIERNIDNIIDRLET